MKSGLLVVVLLLMVNLPLVQSTWHRWQLDSDGVRVAAPAVPLPDADPADRLLSVDLPDGLDAVSGPTGVPMEPAAYDAALDSGTVDVVYLEDDPAIYRIEGRERGVPGWAYTLGANAVLVLLAVAFWRLRGRLRPRLVLVATQDLVRLDAGGDVATLERIEMTTYRVRGEVTAAEDSVLELQVGDRRVLVELDGRAGDVPVGASVEVVGTMVG
ncbi:unannotated protein [freshwater metagenome]|uniref:Unannotated protein n=1 Tax=freshwater metagenome TaxID=449393 RepID=A0A6J6SDE3_9ZZZZ